MNQPEVAAIMIVGEDSHFCYLMRSYVRSSAHPIIFSHPGGGVIEIARREQPAAIVLDVDLPGMDGWALLTSLKMSPDTCEIPVVICSWLDMQERSTQEGANIFLRMPILYGDFLEGLTALGIRVESKSV